MPAPPELVSPRRRCNDWRKHEAIWGPSVERTHRLAMTTDLVLLTLAIILGVVHVLVQSFATKAEARREEAATRLGSAPAEGYASRAERALRNFLETFPIFAAAVLVAHVSGQANEATAIGAHLYFWGRLGYLAAYVMGLFWLRFAMWMVGLAGIIVIVSRILS